MATSRSLKSCANFSMVEFNIDFAINLRVYWSPSETVIHYAEQPSAPYSLINYQYADFTLINNLRVTNNLLWAVRDFSRDTHVIKIGTMGEYGTPNIHIEEGWLGGRTQRSQRQIPFQGKRAAFYHTTKIMDTDLMWFAERVCRFTGNGSYAGACLRP